MSSLLSSKKSPVSLNNTSPDISQVSELARLRVSELEVFTSFRLSARLRVGADFDA